MKTKKQKKLKKYLLFYYQDYYPSGGFEDLHSSYSKLKDAIEYSNNLVESCSTVSVVNRDTGEIKYNRHEDIDYDDSNSIENR